MAITWMGTVWAIATVYPVRTRAVNGGNVYKCTQAGTSANAGPGPAGTGSAIADNQCVWAYLGPDAGSVTAIATHLSTVAPAAQIVLLDMVDREVPVGTWGDLADDGARYLAAHLGTLASLGGGGAVTAETIGPFSRSYATPKGINGSLGLSAFGAEYERLLYLLPGSIGGFVI